MDGAALVETGGMNTRLVGQPNGRAAVQRDDRLEREPQLPEQPAPTGVTLDAEGTWGSFEGDVTGAAAKQVEAGRPGIDVGPGHAEAVVMEPEGGGPLVVAVLIVRRTGLDGRAEDLVELGAPGRIPGDVVGGRQEPRLGVAVALRTDMGAVQVDNGRRIEFVAMPDDRRSSTPRLDGRPREDAVVPQDLGRLPGQDLGVADPLGDLVVVGRAVGSGRLEDRRDGHRKASAPRERARAKAA